MVSVRSRGEPSQSRVCSPVGYTVQTNSTLPSSRTRLEVSPRLAPANMVERESGAWSSPSAWPSSWVTVFCTSVATQPVWPSWVQGGASRVVKV